MKTTPGLSQAVANRRAVAIKCVIIYEDLEAGKAGARFCERLAAVVGRVSCCELWNFRVLGIRSVRNEAASAAVDADVVVFAISFATQLPPEVEEWIEFWLWLNEHGRPAVVAVSTRADPGNQRLVSRLQSAARRNNFPFFSQAPVADLQIRERSRVGVNAQNLEVPPLAKRMSRSTA